MGSRGRLNHPRTKHLKSYSVAYHQPEAIPVASEMQGECDFGLFAIAYFEEESRSAGIPYQTIINAYLRQCPEKERHLSFAHA